jgi:two-component system sensor histidine kinase KdpD
LFRRVRIQIEVPDDLPLVNADYVLLDQVVTNLLENAARHSGADARVTVSARQVGGAVELVVTDDGPGLPDEVRSSIFEPFRSGGRAGSTGVGLAICKAVVDAHAGTIRVGDGPGGGAAFTVTLPIH